MSAIAGCRGPLSGTGARVQASLGLVECPAGADRCVSKEVFLTEGQLLQLLANMKGKT